MPTVPWTMRSFTADLPSRCCATPLVPLPSIDGSFLYEIVLPPVAATPVRVIEDRYFPHNRIVAPPAAALMPVPFPRDQ